MATEDQLRDVLARLRAEFLDGCEDRLAQIGEALGRLRGHDGDWERNLAELRRHVHSIKGAAGTFGFAAIGHIAHALEDFLEVLDDLDAFPFDDVQIFLDRIAEIADRGRNPADDEVESILRALPARPRHAAWDQSVRNTRVLLVMPPGLWRTIVGKELAGCGFQVTLAERAIEAIDRALAAPPDIIVSAMVLDSLSGAELANVFKAIETTRRARFVLVTSYSGDDPMVADLPADAAVIEKDTDFARRFSEQMRTWGVFPGGALAESRVN